MDDATLKNRNLVFLLIVVELLLSGSINYGSAQISEADIVKSTSSPGTLTIVISSNNSVTLSVSDLMAMPKTIVDAELLCFGRSIKGGSWGGVQLGLLLEAAGLVENPASLRFYASDGYSIYVSNYFISQEDVIIAYELDGADLYETLRLVIPGVNGESWISMITVISVDTTTYVNQPNPQAAYVALDPLQNIQKPPPSQPPKPSRYSRTKKSANHSTNSYYHQLINRFSNKTLQIRLYK